jgi:hypothetical protein
MWVKAGDLDADGYEDVIEIDNEGFLAVFLGRGDGTFEDRLITEIPSDPYSLAIADLNGDGLLDAAVAIREFGLICVLFGNGDGTFQPRLDLVTGARPTCVIAADISGDQRLDLVVTNAWANRIHILRNLGIGNVGISPKGSSSSLWTAPFPNPSSSVVKVRFRLTQSEFAEFRVQDISGRSVRSVERGWFPAGDHQVVWDGADDTGHRVPAGLYFVELRSSHTHETRRVTMLR